MNRPLLTFMEGVDGSSPSEGSKRPCWLVVPLPAVLLVLATKVAPGRTARMVIPTAGWTTGTSERTARLELPRHLRGERRANRRRLHEIRRHRSPVRLHLEDRRHRYGVDTDQ